MVPKWELKHKETSTPENSMCQQHISPSENSPTPQDKIPNQGIPSSLINFKQQEQKHILDSAVNARGETPAYRNNIHASHGCSTCTLQLLPSSVTELRLTARTNPAQHPQAGRALTAGPLITAIHAVQPAIAAHAFLNAAPGVAGKLARAGWEGGEAKQHVSPAAAPPAVIPNALSFLLAASNVKNSFPSEQRTTRRSAGKQDVLLSPEKHAS